MSRRDHAPLAPSAAPIWMECSGSVALMARYPHPEDDPKSVEGTIAHAVVAARMSGLDTPSGATDEMLEGADMFEDEVYSQVVRGTPLQIECRVDCLGIHPQNYGTPDCTAVDPFTRSIRVWDYKFGHRYVTPHMNWQLINYAWGILAALKAKYPAEWTIRLGIVQPRNYHPDGPVRSWSITGAELLELGSRMSKQAFLATSDKAVTRTNEHCIDCDAIAHCPAQMQAAQSALDVVDTLVPFDLEPDERGALMVRLQRAKSIIVAREAGESDFLISLIKQGVNIKGWMTQQGSGREKWKSVDDALALGQMMGVDVAKPGAITPKQAIKAGIPAAVVASYTETPVGEIKLVPDKLNRVFGGK